MSKCVVFQFVTLPVAIGAWALTTWVNMTVWGWYMPRLFGLPVLTFWQVAGLALILNSLCKASLFTVAKAKQYEDYSFNMQIISTCLTLSAAHMAGLGLAWAFSKGAF